MSYDARGAGPFEYFPCRYGASKLLFRGPKRRPEGQYVTVLGGNETYGRFIETPFPGLLEGLYGQPVLNLGIQNAGADVFLSDSTVTELCHGAAVTVIEITGAHNISNRFYSVHPRRNDRFLKPSPLLQTLYPDTDYIDVHFTRHLLAKLADISPDKFQMVVQELKDAWVTRMSSLIDRIDGKVILLWMSEHRMARANDDPLNGGDPLFVSDKMVSCLRSKVAGVVEVVADAQELAEGYTMMRFADLDAPIAREMLGPMVHRRAAQRLSEAIATL